MSPSPTFRRWFAAAFALVVSLSPAVAGWAGIEDKGDFFSASAEASAQRQITELQRSIGKDFAIETFASIPAEAGTAPGATDKAALNRFMEHWAEGQAGAKRVNGVFAVLVKAPPHLQVVVGNDTQRRAFTLRDRDTLVSLMLAKLRAKEFDGALTEGVNFVATTMRAHVGTVPGALATSGSASSRYDLERSQPAVAERTQPAVARPSALGGLLPIVIIGLGLWLVTALFRALRGGGGSPMAPGVGGSGGGFMSSLMGGLFGAAAGMWMYNQSFGGSSAFGSDVGHSGQESGPSSFSGEDTNYSGSGGSFGDDSGGGGFGGGDSGGGGGDF